MSLRGMISAIALGILILGSPQTPQAEEARCTKTHSIYRWNGGMVNHFGEEGPADCIKRNTSAVKVVANEKMKGSPQAAAPASSAASKPIGYETYRWANSDKKALSADQPTTVTASKDGK